MQAVDQIFYKLGVDAGSTTIKVVLLDEKDQVIYKSYQRHYSEVRLKLEEEMSHLAKWIMDKPVKVCLTGSAGYGIANECGLPFVQEVFATAYGVRIKYEEVDVVIELGGEDAKIIFLSGGLEERMNSTCAGGTGAFIDQMAILMDVKPEELDRLSRLHESIYPIASRCGVFAKSDIQPLLNQGVRKEDLSASIFQAVVDQTIAGLAQGRKIEGKVLFLGGPLFFYQGLQERFVETLKLGKEQGVFPEDAQNFVAVGCAYYALETEEIYRYKQLMKAIHAKKSKSKATDVLPCLFEDQVDYEEFKHRHNNHKILRLPIGEYEGKAYLGIDAGSTTTKIILMGEEGEILYDYYESNKGNPVEVVRRQLETIYKECGNRIQVSMSGVTGYGEELIRNAFRVDIGIVETLAHFTAARCFEPDVEFILDIGGQDIKCFKVKNGVIESIMLNEACSSGCGSFIETFAQQMGYKVEEFVKMGLFAKHPVDLGSRCTVFMNSAVKQAQKEGASLEEVSAGLAISIVKNAIYKVIRARKVDELGKAIVVQGGTLLNDAILRSLERELEREVIRPNIAGLMGAYGVALYAKKHSQVKSSLLSEGELKGFQHMSKASRCHLCTNKCQLIINQFGEGRSYLSGNRCERPIKGENIEQLPNLYRYKYQKIRNMEPKEGVKGIIGIPVVLNMYELLPFWSSFFSSLGFKVLLSDPSSKKLYRKGEYSIPSDTVCYPAKLVHGHIESLIDKGVKYIFYPCMTYNLDEGISDNTFNCPIVAYYPELIHANVNRLKSVDFIYPHLSFNEPKVLTQRLYQVLRERFDFISYRLIEESVAKGYKALHHYQFEVREEGKKALEYAKEHHKRIVMLGGRPYHIDPEINHGIDKMINGLDAVVMSEDSLEKWHEKPKVNVLNQWTYQARLYSSAYQIGEMETIDLVQLVSFGCGTDAITSDEIRDILERKNKLYTQLKIDETSNLGAAKIRMRSLFASAVEQ